MTEKEIDNLAKIVWDYHCIRQNLEKADLIFVLCSYDIRVAEYAAELFLKKYAPRILFSGGLAHQDDILATGWNESEARKFTEVAISKGVPGDKILIEDQATNTGENFKFSHEVLTKNQIPHKKIILVQKPFMLRRTQATFLKQWPGEKVKTILTAPNIDFESYPNEILDKEKIINTMLGDLQRIKIYPKMGYQAFQEIPEAVWEAFKKLVQAGFDKHLIRDKKTGKYLQ